MVMTMKMTEPAILGHDKIAGVLHGAEQRLFVRPQKLRRQPFGPAFLIITGTRDILKVPPSFLCHAGLCTNPNPCDNLTTQVQTEYNKKLKHSCFQP